RHVVPWAELKAAGAAVVPGDDVVGVSRLHEGVEGIRGRHVPEGGSGRVEQLPALGQHHYLGELPPGGVIAWAEGAVTVPGDSPMAEQPPDRLVEVVGGLHVREGDHAGCGRGTAGGIGGSGRVSGRGWGRRRRRLAAGGELELADAGTPARAAG